MSDDQSLGDLPQPEYEGTVPVDELETDGDNPNEMTDNLFDVLVDRIESRGWIGNAIIVDQDNCIADGQHRWEAAKELGLSEVPVKRYTMTDSERRLVRQEMNKIRGEHDYQDDRDELDQLLDAGYDSEVTELLEGRDEADEFDDLLDGTPDFDPVGEDEQPSLDESEDSEGENTVRCPDCGNTFTHE